MPDTDPHRLLDHFAEASASVRRALDKLTHEQMNARTGRVGQYGLDLVADRAALNVLRTLDVAIVSEESLYSGNDDAPVTVDARSGRRLHELRGTASPYYATSIAAIDGDGLLCRIRGRIRRPEPSTGRCGAKVPPATVCACMRATCNPWRRRSWSSPDSRRGAPVGSVPSVRLRVARAVRAREPGGADGLRRWGSVARPMGLPRRTTAVPRSRCDRD